MGMNRTGKFIVSCCGAAMWSRPRDRHRRRERRHPAGIVRRTSRRAEGPGRGWTLADRRGPTRADAERRRRSVALPGRGDGADSRYGDREPRAAEGETYYGKARRSSARRLRLGVALSPGGRRRASGSLLSQLPPGISLWKEGSAGRGDRLLTRAATLDPKSVKPGSISGGP